MITPKSAAGRSGNRVTAARWAARLRELGHHVAIRSEYNGERGDVLVALHARRSATAVRRFHASHPQSPIVVVLTGTDVYGDLHGSAAAQGALELATRIVVLQRLALRELRRRWRRKSAVILQSAVPGGRRAPARPLRQARAAARGERTGVGSRPRNSRADRRPPPAPSTALVLAHLRAVKDPLRAAYAARLLPEESGWRVVHGGFAHDAGWARRARAEMRRNRRYAWVGEVSRPAAERLLARARVLVVPSRLEGGANVVSEAIAHGLPVLASRIPGNVGLLGERYPGYFPTGNAAALAVLLRRVESDLDFELCLRRHVQRLSSRFSPERERRDWQRLLAPLLGRRATAVGRAPLPRWAQRPTLHASRAQTIVMRTPKRRSRPSMRRLHQRQAHTRRTRSWPI
jgi:glycosyltransferase involved in cell wall biosynthesis